MVEYILKFQYIIYLMHTFLRNTFQKTKEALINNNLRTKIPCSSISMTKSTISNSIRTFSKFIPKYYADVNSNQPQEYWDYENYENSWG